MSEPIYLTFSLLCIASLAHFFQNNRKSSFVIAAVASALAYLTRYVGITIVVTGTLSFLLFMKGTWKNKIQKAVLFGLIGFVPILAWYLRNYLLTGSFTNRVIAFHPITAEKFNQGLLTVLGWLLPETIAEEVRVVVAILFGGVLIFGMVFRYSWSEGRNLPVEEQKPLHKILLLYGGIYLIFLVISLTFFDNSTRLNDRILLPVYLILLMITVFSIYWIFQHWRGRTRPFVLVISFLLPVIILGNYVIRTAELVQTFREEGRGFSSASWRSSEIISMIGLLGNDPVLYTNEAAAVYYLTGIGAYSIPEKFDPVVAKVRDDFQPTMEKMRHRLTEPNSALVVFHQGYLREGMPTLDEIMAGLVIAHESRDGVILVDPVNIEEWDKGCNVGCKPSGKRIK
jgi:hypothetical protein